MRIENNRKQSPYAPSRLFIACTFCDPVFGAMKTEFTIPFNTYVKRKATAPKEEDTDEGPIVERICPKCGNDKMSYATLQLRSADEGQTVFYTCTNCKWVDSPDEFHLFEHNSWSITIIYALPCSADSRKPKTLNGYHQMFCHFVFIFEKWI